MRLIVTILWCLAALLWLPWALMFLRLIFDLATGTAWGQSFYVAPVFIGIWPVHGLFRPWEIVSWWPLSSLTGMLLSAAGWRIYWFDQDGIMTRPPTVIFLSIVLPVLAPFIMYGDARRRYIERELELDGSVNEAVEQLGEQEKSPD